MADFRFLPFWKGPPFGPRDLSLETGPVVQRVEPPLDRVAGGATVTITGLRFRNEAGGAAPTVLFGAVPATNVVVVSGTSITCTVPAAAGGAVGTVNLTVTIAGQSSTLPRAFTYISSQIISLEPGFGPIAGGTTVIVKGANFVTGSSITFGGSPGTSTTFIDDETYATVTPNHAQGFVDVVMTEAGGASFTLRNGFKYTLLVRGEDIRRSPGISIQDALNNSPNQCSFRIDGASNTPMPGEKIEIRDEFDGDRLLFAGTLQSYDMLYEEQIHQIAWDCVAVDFTWLLNKFRPHGVYKNISASTIVTDLVARFAPGFTVEFVQTNLAKISITFDGSEDFGTCLSNIAKAIGGGHWYVDYQQRLHFFHKSPLSEIATIIRNGPGNSMTVVEGAAIPATFSFEAGFYAFRVSFVYSLGFESAMSPLSPFVALQGTRIIDFSNIPTGSAAGSHTVVARRIYMYKVAHSEVLPVAKFVEIPNNTTTAFTTWFKATGASVSTITEIDEDEPLPLVRRGAPPGGSGVPLSAQVGEADIFIPQFPPLVGTGLTAATYRPGPWAFRASFLYRDGSESYPSVPSNVVVLEGSKSARITGLPVGETINGVPCIARKIYACSGSTNTLIKSLSEVVAELKAAQSRATLVNEYGHIIGVNDAIRLQGTFPIPSDYNSLAQIIGFGDLENLLRSTATNPPDWSPERTSLWYFVPDNTTIDADIGPGYLEGGLMIPPPGEGIPEWPHPDGPYLEDFDPPDPLNHSNTRLLREPPVRVSVDLSQIRNRVKVRGAGTSLAAGVFPGATQLQVVDTSLFAAGGGFVVVGASQVLRYTSTSGSSGAGTINLARSNVVQFPAKEGDPVSLWFQADDEESQRTLAEVELDKDGRQTDGVHETVINDPSLTTPFMLYMRAYAELELFGRPIQTITYATTDPKTRSGATISVDLTNPPVKGNFLIQSVGIDQIRDEGDQLSPRYTVSASTVKFDLSDLLLQIVERTLGSEQASSPTGLGEGEETESSDEQFIDRLDSGFAFAFVPTTGAVSFTFVGPAMSVAASGGGSNVLDNRGLWRRHSTGTTSGGTSSVIAAGTNVRLANDPVFTLHVRISDLTNVRIWCGFFEAGLSNSDTPSARGFGFRFSPAAGDTGPRLVSFTGAGTLVVGESFPTLLANNEYVIRVCARQEGQIGEVNINGRILQLPINQTLRELTLFNGEFSVFNTATTVAKAVDHLRVGAQMRVG